MRKVVSLVLFLLLTLAVEADVSMQLRRFEQAQPARQVQEANRFFQLLHDSDFMDTLYRYDARTPVDTLRQQVWYWAAEYYYDRQDYEQAVHYGQKALPLCRAGNDRATEADCLSVLALIHIRQGRFEQAAKYAKACNEIDMQMGDPGNISSSLNTLAAIYMSARQPEEAEKYVLKGITYARQAGAQPRLAVLLGMASEVYHHQHKEQQALDYATQAYQLEVQLGNPEKVAIRQAQRAASLISLSRFSEAKAALTEAIPEFRRNGNRHSLGIACNQMGLLLHQEKNDSAAVRYYKEALEIFVSQHDLFNESYSRKGLYDALRKTDPAQAMLHNDRYNELRDSLFDHETGVLLTKYATEYGYEELQARQQEMQRSHRRSLMLMAALLLALLVAGWLVYRYRMRLVRQRFEVLSRRLEELTLQKSEADETRAETGGTDATEQLDEHERQFLMQVIEAVNQGLSTGHYDVEEIASQLNMSESTFRRRLMASAGETPKAYISAIQMQKASTLLTTRSDLPISDVAIQCGFSDTSSFSRAFKRAYGVSPSLYSPKS